MDKKTKLLVGAGIVGVGAYLLWKSKKSSTPAITKASMVGFNSVGDVEKFTNAEGSDFAGVQPRMMSADGDFAGVGSQEKFNAEGSDFAGVQPRMISQNGNQYSKEFFDVKGGKLGVESDLFKKPMTGKMPLVGTENDTPREKFNQTGSSPFKQVKLKGMKDSTFKPMQDTTAKKLVGADGGFFAPRTARFGQNQGFFAPNRPVRPTPAPKYKSPVEPTTPVMVTQKAPINNMVGLINEPEVVDSGWVK